MNRKPGVVLVLLSLLSLVLAGCGSLIAVTPAPPPAAASPLVRLTESDLALYPWTCSVDYEVAPSADLGLGPGASFANTSLTIVDGLVINLIEADEYGLIGVTVLLSDPARQAAFDRLLAEPETFTPMLFQQVGASDIVLLSQMPLALPGEIGERAVSIANEYTLNMLRDEYYWLEPV